MADLTEQEREELIAALSAQQQADADGVMVKVSREAVDKAILALRSVRQEPVDYVMVPREPTETMLDAAIAGKTLTADFGAQERARKYYADAYRKMLSAAPPSASSPEVRQEPVAWRGLRKGMNGTERHSSIKHIRDELLAMGYLEQEISPLYAAPPSASVEQDEFRKGARAMFDNLLERAAMNYHGNPNIQKQCAEENKLVIEWAKDALQEVSSNDCATWHEITKLQEQIAELRGSSVEQAWRQALEEAAKLCEKRSELWEKSHQAWAVFYETEADECVKAIRALAQGGSDGRPRDSQEVRRGNETPGCH